jgi:hypothetical protein
VPRPTAWGTEAAFLQVICCRPVRNSCFGRGVPAGSEFLQIYSRGLVRVLPGTDAAGRCIISIRPSNMTEVPVDPLLIRWATFHSIGVACILTATSS